MYRTLLAAAFALALFTVAWAQDESTFKKAPEARGARANVNKMLSGSQQVIKGAEEAKNKADMDVMAKVLIYAVTDPANYVIRDVNLKKDTELVPIPDDTTIAARIEELDRFILKPNTTTIKMSFDQHDYLIEFGKALNAALAEVINSEDKQIRVNAARMLAVAAKSGAPAHAAMITNLIAMPMEGNPKELVLNTNTPPEVLVYALQAAQGLLAAYDPRNQGSTSVGLHSLADPQLAKLARALEAVVLNEKPINKNVTLKPPPVVAPTTVEALKKDDKTALKKDDKAAPKKDEKVKPSKDAVGTLESARENDNPEFAVIRYYRRLAIRALAEVRYPVVLDADFPAKPLYTLCRIAVNDGTFLPELGADEIAEAVTGLCNLHSIQNVDANVLQSCIALGVRNFAQKKTGNNDASLAWRTYAFRMNNALANFLKVIETNSELTRIQEPMTATAALLTNSVLTPLEQSGKSGLTVINVNEVQKWLTGRKTETMSLYTNLREPEKSKLILKPVTAFK